MISDVLLEPAPHEAVMQSTRREMVGLGHRLTLWHQPQTPPYRTAMIATIARTTAIIPRMTAAHGGELLGVGMPGSDQLSDGNTSHAAAATPRLSAYLGLDWVR